MRVSTSTRFRGIEDPRLRSSKDVYDVLKQPVVDGVANNSAAKFNRHDEPTASGDRAIPRLGRMQAPSRCGRTWQIRLNFCGTDSATGGGRIEAHTVRHVSYLHTRGRIGDALWLS
jgi:hypothetical protein